MKFRFSQQIFEKPSYIKFHYYPSKWEQSCSMRSHGETDMTKLIVGFRSFAKAPNKYGIKVEVKQSR